MILIFLVWSLLFLSTTACEEKQPVISKKDLIEMEVEKRINRLINNKGERCKQELIDVANTIVDSILIARAKASKDTIPKPPKPFKPDQPDAFLLEDSFAIQPLLLDTLGLDSMRIEMDSSLQNEL
ncbi:MAG: hypothetical protein AAF849_24725 [Bacteroidota bacterium]